MLFSRKPVTFRASRLAAFGVLGIQVLFSASLALSLAGAFSAFARAGLFCALIAGAAFLFLGAAEVLLERETQPRILLLGIWTGALVLYSFAWVKPTERILGENDEVIYLASAQNLITTGGTVLHSALLDRMDAGERNALLKYTPPHAQRTRAEPRTYLAYHFGLFVPDAASNGIMPQFPPGYPLVLAAFAWTLPLEQIGFVNAFFHILNATLLLLIVSSFLSRTAGLAAGILCLFFPLEVWVANTLYAEPVCQSWWLLALCMLRLRAQQSTWALEVAAGLAVANLAAIKMDGVFVSLAAALLAAPWGNLGRLVQFLGAYIAGAAIVGAAWAATAGFYLHDSLAAWGSSMGVRLPAILGACFAVAVVVWAIRRFPRFASSMKIVLAFVLAFLAIYAAFLRPLHEPKDAYFYWPLHEIMQSHREESMVQLAWYFTWPILGAALTGSILLLFRLRERWQALFWIVGMMATVFVLFDPRNFPGHPYVFRRLLVFGSPLLLTGTAAVFAWIGEWFAKRCGKEWMAPVFALLCATVAILAWWPMNARLSAQRNFGTLVHQIRVLADRLPENAVVLIADQSNPAQYLATPLEFLFQRPSLILKKRLDGTDPHIVSLIKKLQASGHRTFQLTFATEGEVDGIIKFDFLRYEIGKLPAGFSTGGLPYRIEEIVGGD